MGMAGRGIAGAGAAGGGGAAAGAGAGAAGAFGTLACFPISIVPRNFGAAAPFMLNPHLEQVAAVSGFWVQQFGQNTPPPPHGRPSHPPCLQGATPTPCKPNGTDLLGSSACPRRLRKSPPRPGGGRRLTPDAVDY